MYINIAEIIYALKLSPVPHVLKPHAREIDVTGTYIRLEIELPDSYRQFVREYADGATLYECQHICGLDELAHIEGDGDLPSYEGGSHPAAHIIPVSPDAHGNAWVFLTRTHGHDGECPVAYLAKGVLYRRLDSFYSWLSFVSIKKRELIGTLYGEEIVKLLGC